MKILIVSEMNGHDRSMTKSRSLDMIVAEFLQAMQIAQQGDLARKFLA